MGMGRLPRLLNVHNLDRRIKKLERAGAEVARQRGTCQQAKPTEDRSKAEKSLYEFLKQAWHVLEPATTYVDGWHIRAMCDHLEAVTDGRIRDLLVNIPPRHMKSLTVAVLWPCWCLDP